MRNSTCCICENIGADQLCSNCEADQHLNFIFCDCTAQFMPDLFGNYIVGFLTSQLVYHDAP